MLVESGKTKDEFVSTLHQSINTEDKIKHLPIILSYIEHLKLKIVPYKYTSMVWRRRNKHKIKITKMFFEGTVFSANEDDAMAAAVEQITNSERYKNFDGYTLVPVRVNVKEQPISDFAEFDKNVRVAGEVDFILGSTDNWQDWLKYATESEVKDCLADIFKTCKTSVQAEKEAA